MLCHRDDLTARTASVSVLQVYPADVGFEQANIALPLAETGW